MWDNSQVTILLDRRKGSGELQGLFSQHGATVRLSDLDAGDIAFEGLGPSGLCLIGIERKALADMLDSIQNGRYSGIQLPKLLRDYDYRYLFVEGVWRSGPDGLLEVLSGARAEWAKWMPLKRGRARTPLHSALDNWLSSQELRTPVKVKRTCSPEDTVATVLNLWHLWNDEVWAAHHSHLSFYEPEPQDGYGHIYRPGLVRRVAKELEGVGWKRSSLVAGKFRSVREMALADVRDWVIKGTKAVSGIGPKLAKSIHDELGGLK
jgi:ERCC4-type nuclease